MPYYLFLFAFSLNIYLGSSSPAWAYLDPGTGSMILQLLIASIAGALVVIKMYWYKLKKFFSREKSPVKDKDDIDRP